MEFGNQTHEDVIQSKYGIVSPKRPEFVFHKLQGADGPFQNGLNKANAFNDETNQSEAASNKPRLSLREMLYQNRLYKNNTKQRFFNFKQARMG